MTSPILARNNVTDRGTGGPTLVFAHGFGCDQTLWHAVAPDFEKDHRVIRFDYVGCGRSDLSAYDPVRYATLEGYVGDLLEVVEALDLRDVVFVGHSVSATVGLLASIRQPERFRKLVLLGPSARYLNDLPDYVGGFERADLEGLFDLMDRNYIGWADFLAPLVAGNPDRPHVAGALRDAFCSTEPRIARRFAEATFFADNRADLAQVPVPVVVLQSQDDAIAPLRAGRFVAEGVPDGTFVQMDAKGHLPHVSFPDEVVRRIRDALRDR